MLPLSFVNILDENFFSPAISGLLFSQPAFVLPFISVNLQAIGYNNKLSSSMPIEDVNPIRLTPVNKLKCAPCRDSVPEMSLKVNSLYAFSSYCDGTGENRVAS